MFEVTFPLALIFIAIFENLSAVALLHTIVHLAFIVSTGVIFEHPHEEG